ncbi:TonB-dependent receptor [Flavihumibacter petaseus]|uniref:Putative TonB-dependent receptor n=1 Tax=Flavihumibacter petaseus NBRC 106054 TaxID=1220578 RepID=A0A0E9MZJ8_9BACT|nr:TonB-dependent receptor [Flavihumibacter petaseus]GAO43014.1 putative TonB-dependent receptor [Flavihumibacter petaseus NBRC 106054]
MKLTVLLLTAAFLQVSAVGTAQKISFSGKNVNLKSVFTSIEKQTGFVFFYNNNDLRNTQPLSLDVRDLSLEETLDICLRNQPLHYVIKGKTIFIREKELQPPAANQPPPVADNAGIDVSGRVVDDHGDPMPGVSVLVKGTKNGTKTDEQGRFTLPDVDPKAILEFSFIGFGTVEHKVATKQENITITLTLQATALSDLVMVGYGSSKRKDLTGSVASVNVNEIKNTPFVSVDQALAGKAAGVQVTQADGSPGGVARIRIRGGASLIGGNDPLYVIDGVQVPITNNYVQSAADVVNPIERLGQDGQYMDNAIGSSFARGLNTLAGLNINDIESIDILKDASATAIYGSRAANGVVIITTKKGKKNEKPILEANFYTGFSKPITEKLLNTEQYKSVMLEGAKNLNALLADQGKPADPLASAIINDPTTLGTANTDWMDLVTRTGISNNLDVSVRGGGTGSRYYTSLAYAKQTGTLEGTDFSRISGKVNLDNEITPKLRLITNLDYGFTKNNITDGIYSSAQFVPPTYAPFAADGSPAVFDPISFGSAPYEGIQNPMTLLQGKNTSKNLLLLGSMSVEYEIVKSLKFKSTASVNYNNYHQLNYVPSTVMVSDASGAIPSNGGIATQAQTQRTDAFFENTLTWDKQFNRDNRINLLAGTSWQRANAQSFTAAGQGFPDDEFLNGLSSAALALPPKNSESQSSLLSFYLRANYAWKERYLFTVTARSDESSKFPKNNRVGYFPSFGVAWRASEESFLRNVTWLDELKFRASAGYTGTQNLGDNLFYTLYTPASYASTNALIPTQLGNDKIKWETTLQKDAGIDFAMFKNRLRGAIGYYSKNSSDLLMAYNVATSSGFASALVNLADISNKGLEIDLRVDAIRNKNITWNIALNVSGNRSKVTKINDDIQDPTKTGYSDPFYRSQFDLGNTILREGQPVGQIYGYIYQGVIKTQKEMEEYKARSLYAQYGFFDYLALGYPMYQTIDSGTYKGYFARDIIGSAEPKFYGGVTNTFSYKQFSVMALLTFSYGGDLLYLPDLKAFGVGDLTNRNTRILQDHWSKDNPDANRPSLVLKETNSYGTGASSAQVHDASYIKLKSITVNYEIPQRLLSKCHMRTAMVYVSGSNLFTITGYPGPDPEISNDPYSLINGYTDAGTYPTMRQFNAGVRLGF